MSSQVCRTHRRTGCDSCRTKSRSLYTEDYSPNLFTTVGSSWSTSHDDGPASHGHSGGGGGHSDGGGHHGGGGGHSGGDGGGGGGGD